MTGWRIVRSLLLALALAPACPVAAALAQDAPMAVQQSDSGVVFDFQHADLRVVVSALADVAGIPIVYAGLPSRTVTLRTGRPVPISAVRGLLDGVARANGLELVQEGNLLRVVEHEQPPRAAPAHAPTADTTRPTQRRLYVLPLRHARARVIAQTLGGLFGLGGTGEGGAGMDATSLSQALEMQRAQPYRELQPVRPQPNAPRAGAAPTDTSGGLAAILAAPVKIVPDELTNSLLVLATPRDYATVRAAIEKLDVRPLQVLIEVFIVEVRHNKNFSLGLSAGVPFNSSGGDSTSMFSLTAPSAGDVMLRFLDVGNVSANVVLRALAASGNVRILSRPVLLAQNNQRARILVGDQRPFIQLFRALPTDAAVRDQVVQYRNVGTQLTIRPTINADGYVTLSVLQEVNNATSETQFGAPVINTREAETQLMIKDGHTAVLGGLVDRQQESTNSGIPILKDIPILGVLFRSSAKQTTVNELFLLLTPHVLRTDADMDSAAVRVRERSEVLHELLGDSTLFDAPTIPDDAAAMTRDSIDRTPADTVRTRPPADTSSSPADTSVAPIDTTRVRRDTAARRRGGARP